MKHLCLLFAILSFLDCKAQKGHEDLAKEVIISGRVFNREVYPKEKEVKLEIPYLSGLETVYTSPIADDGTFCFRFSSYASTREVALRNYAEHLYVHLITTKIKSSCDIRFFLQHELFLLCYYLMKTMLFLCYL